VLYKPDPEFSEEARKAKLQGTIVLEADVELDGKAHRVKVRNGLGLGLDEKAIEAVQKWRFRPAQRNGKSVVVRATIYINFRLL
jgi:TonB family protein